MKAGGRIALVTGANQGLGFALVEALCRELGPGATVYLTARSPERGAEAVRRLEEQGLAPRFERLDVTDIGNVEALAETLQARHGGVDLVISNAAARILREPSQASQAAAFIDTNNHGTFRMIRAFGPLLRDDGRYLVVASGFGTLLHLPQALHAGFDTESASLEDIEALMDRYVGLVEAGLAQAEGWPDWINIPSKIAQVASARIFARQVSADPRRKGVLVNAVCPGLVDTEASRPWFEDMSSAQTPAQAARDVVWLATLPAGTSAPHGELVQKRKLLSWS